MKTELAGLVLASSVFVPTSRGRAAEISDTSSSAAIHYNAIGVGAYSPGIVHAESDVARLDIGVGEWSVAISLGPFLAAQAGYQYGGSAFVGFDGGKWSARVGIKPDNGAWSSGIAFGAPLLPLPSVVASCVVQGYRGATNRAFDTAMVDPALTGIGPVADALKAGSTLPFGAGAQLGYAPDDVGLYAFASLQGGF